MRWEHRAMSRDECEQLLREQWVGRLAMTDGEFSYVVPVFFAYHDGKIIVHSSARGLKMEILRQGKPVCFEVDHFESLLPGHRPCNTGGRFRSVLCFGRPSMVEDPSEKARYLGILCRRYGITDEPMDFGSRALAEVVVLLVTVEHMTGKKSP